MLAALVKVNIDIYDGLLVPTMEEKAQFPMREL